MKHWSNILSIVLVILCLLTLISPIAAGLGLPLSGPIQPSVVTVTVLHPGGSPVTGAFVNAYSQDWGWRVEESTNQLGKATLNLAEGRWAFRAVSHGFYVLTPSVSVEATSAIVTLQATVTSSLELTSPHHPSSILTGARIELVEAECGHLFPLKEVGTYPGSAMSFETNAGLSARIYVALGPKNSYPGIIELSDTVAFDGTAHTIQVAGSRCALYRFPGIGPTGDPVPQVHLQFHMLESAWPWSPWIADIQNSAPSFYLSPHHYYCIRAIDLSYDRAPRLVLQPLSLAPQPGEERELPMGGPLIRRIQAHPRANTSFKPNTQVMLYTEDSFGNVAVECWISGARRGITVQITDRVQTESVSTDSSYAKVPREFQPASHPSVSVTYNWGSWGSGTITKALYDPEVCKLEIAQTPRLIDQTAPTSSPWRTVFRSHLEELAAAMESDMILPTDYPMGVIDNILHAGFENETLHGFKLELGISLNRPVGWPLGDGFIAHEMGHGRIHKPPARFFGRYLESMASHWGSIGMSRVFGDPEYFRFLEAGHRLFLDHLHGAPVDNLSKEIEVAEFIYEYVRLRHGPSPIRAFVLEWNNALKGIRDTLSYTPEREEFALLSYLAGENLGPLVEQAGLPASASQITAALNDINAWRNAASGPELAYETSSLEISSEQVAVPFCLQRAPAPGIRIAEGDLVVVGNDVEILDVVPRHLPWESGWSFEKSKTNPQRWHVRIQSPHPVQGPGALAQVVLWFKPMSVDQSSIQLKAESVVVDGFPISVPASSVNLPSSPVIRTLPVITSVAAGVSYRCQLSAFAGSPPYSWSVAEGSLPPGMRLSEDGLLQGTPTASGHFQFTACVEDQQHDKSYRIFDLPQAEAPRNILQALWRLFR